MRYLRPTWVYPILQPITDALALSYDPEPEPGNNCACDRRCTNEVACVILGSGHVAPSFTASGRRSHHTHRRRPHHTYHRRSYLVLEILLPLLLFSLLASSLLGPLFRLIGRTLRLGLGIAIRAVDFIAAKVLDPILEKILP